MVPEDIGKLLKSFYHDIKNFNRKVSFFVNKNVRNPVLTCLWERDLSIQCIPKYIPDLKYVPDIGLVSEVLRLFF